MKQFFKFFFASLLGSFISFVILFFIFLGILISVISYSEKDAINVKPNSLLHLRLNEPILDRTPANPFSDFNFADFSLETPPGLNEILENIEKAKNDKNIKGIYLELDYIPAGIATIQEIRNALVDFKESGKFILCYSNIYTQPAYYLGTVADKVYLNPEGMILLKGLNSEVVFLKGTLDKLEINAQVIRSGKYKSAVEIFERSDMSKENEDQLGELIESIWSEMLKDISNDRNISIYDLNLNADNLELTDAHAAFKHGFIDSLIYKDEMIEVLNKRLNLKGKDNLNLISLNKYVYSKKDDKKEFTKDKIAVIYAQGEITMAGEDMNQINGEKYAKTIRKAREDKNVKAIVIRVNSPGGDAVASEIIRREVHLAAKEKTVVVSMGDYAASGGYWISCSADKIVADQTTITGSIGVYGIIPDFKDFMNNKLGVTFDNVKTNENADFIPVNKPLSPYQEAIIRGQIDKTYEQFISLVAEGRNLRVSHVDSIAQGKVWSGTDAKRIGLVDELGGLEMAIEEAANMAELKNYYIEELPVQKDPLAELFETTMDETKTGFLKKELGENYKYYHWIKQTSQQKGIQTRLPFFLSIK